MFRNVLDLYEMVFGSKGGECAARFRDRFTCPGNAEKIIRRCNNQRRLRCAHFKKIRVIQAKRKPTEETLFRVLRPQGLK